MVSALPLLAPLLSGTLVACGGGTYEPTVVDQTRIITVVADPPEARPGDRVDATVWLANPDQVDMQIMFWTCLFLEDGSCAEATFAEELEQWVTVGSGDAGTLVTARELPQQADQYLQGDSAMAGVQVFALACPVDDCEILDEVRAGMDAYGVPEDIAEKLSNPLSWLDDLEMDQVSMVTRDFIVSNREGGIVNQNPVYEARFAEAMDETIVVEAGRSVDLAFHVEDPNGESVYCYPYTTQGRFSERKTKAEDDQVRLYLDAPDEPGEGRIWVVFDDRDGGLAVYSQALSVVERSE